MARVVISSAAIQAQVGPGVNRWANRVLDDIRDEARRTAPVGKPGDAMHRQKGTLVGAYRRGIEVDRATTVGPATLGRVDATADHSNIVEWGTEGAVGKRQVFSRVAWRGKIRTVYEQHGHPGTHNLIQALWTVAARHGMLDRVRYAKLHH